MRKYSSNLAFVDLLFNLLVGFTSLFIIAFLMINPISKNGEVDPPVMMMVQVRWNDESVTDVDTWVRSPNSLVGYTNRESGYVALDRDDLGRNNDTYEVNGEKYVVKRNYEVVNFTAMPDGEYIFNVQMFSVKLPEGPVEVAVTITTLGPYKEIWTGNVLLEFSKQEVTALTFVVSDGKIQDLNDQIQIKVKAKIEGSLG
jgi:hypothetical protein